jgi:uncharacterized protein YsxB (DUF464 family)
MSGHALFDDPGKDIVCAGASAVVVGSLNAMEQLTGISMVIKDFEKGIISFEVPNTSENEKIQFLLEGMLVSLQTIERDYRDYIKIHIQHVK